MRIEVEKALLLSSKKDPGTELQLRTEPNRVTWTIVDNGRRMTFTMTPDEAVQLVLPVLLAAGAASAAAPSPAPSPPPPPQKGEVQ